MVLHLPQHCLSLSITMSPSMLAVVYVKAPNGMVITIRTDDISESLLALRKEGDNLITTLNNLPEIYIPTNNNNQTYDEFVEYRNNLLQKVHIYRTVMDFYNQNKCEIKIERCDSTKELGITFTA
jgi:hypothetical protein